MSYQKYYLLYSFNTPFNEKLGIINEIFRIKEICDYINTFLHEWTQWSKFYTFKEKWSLSNTLLNFVNTVLPKINNNMLFYTEIVCAQIINNWCFNIFILKISVAFCNF